MTTKENVTLASHIPLNIQLQFKLKAIHSITQNGPGKSFKYPAVQNGPKKSFKYPTVQNGPGKSLLNIINNIEIKH